MTDTEEVGNWVKLDGDKSKIWVLGVIGEWEDARRARREIVSQIGEGFNIVCLPHGKFSGEIGRFQGPGTQNGSYTAIAPTHEHLWLFVTNGNFQEAGTFFNELKRQIGDKILFMVLPQIALSETHGLDLEQAREFRSALIQTWDQMIGLMERFGTIQDEAAKYGREAVHGA